MRDQDETAARAAARLANLFGRDVLPVEQTPADPVESRPPRLGEFADWARRADLLTDPSRRGTVALVLLALAAVLVAGLLLWRARPEPVTAAPVAEPLAVASSGAPSLLLIDVQGEVRRPGIVRLPQGARVADAIAAAGGLKPGAHTRGLNLARRLSDGEQVLVGIAVASAAGPDPGPAGPGSAAKLDLNLATQEQLEALPGVGPVLAGRILAWRQQHGRFASVDQLREVKGIGARTFEELRALVVV